MKKLIFIVLCLFAMISGNGQTIVEGEYFFNTEPGVGNGNPLSFTSGDSVEFDVNLSLASLPNGFNHLYMRFQMDNGLWGMLYHKTIYHLSLPSNNTIVAGEYFFNTDPGIGNGLPVSLTAGDSTELDINLSVSGLNTGFNHLYMRFKTTDNHWGLVHHKVLYVLPNASNNTVVSGEFFVDLETGVGNGTPFEIIAPADSVEQDFILSLPELSLGEHTLYIRYKTESGHWGMLEQRPFNVCESYGANSIFSYTENGNTVYFQNESVNADSILWNFGDNTSSILHAPIHVFEEPGVYTVSLLAHNDCGESTLEQQITIEGLESVTPHLVSNTGISTLSIIGFGFIDGTIVSIVRDGFETITPVNLTILNDHQIQAIVNFNGAEIGLWNLQVEIPGVGIFTLNESIDVIDDNFQTSNITFSQVQISETRTGRRSPGFATVQNGNSTDMLAVPVFFRDIQDVDHVYYEQTSPITSIDFFADAYQYLLDNTITNTVMQSQHPDAITNSKFSGYILPKVAAGSSTTIPLFIRRSIQGTHHCGAMMIYPQLNSNSLVGPITYENEICWNSFAKAAFESATAISFDQTEWDNCFGSWKDSLFQTIAEMASNNEISHLPVSMAASFTSIFTHMAEDGCVSNFPILTEEILNNTLVHMLANFTYLNDATEVALTCPQLQGIITSDHHDELLDGSNRENEFCDLAKEVGGNSFLNSAGAASQYCKLFGNGVDPNKKYGPGDNVSNVYVDPGEVASYTITFENDSAATAPADRVIVTDQLDISKFNVASFRWGPIAISDSTFIFPNDAQRQQNILTDLRPTYPYFLLTSLSLNEDDGLAEWTFATLDTTNLQPLDYLLGGFLPPNINGTEGNGSVSFTIQFKNELTTGDTIYNNASIVFDENEAIITPQWMNVIDNTSPESEVIDLPSEMTSNTFLVDWTGTDSPAGIAHYSIYVSTNDGPYYPWLIAETATQATFTGEIGNVYKFYSRALDNAGNFEDAPTEPLTNYDAITALINGVENHRNLIGLNIYPIPASQFVHFTYNAPQTIKVKYDILDLTGKVLLSSNSASSKSGVVSETIDISALSSGVYLLRLNAGQVSYMEKFIVE